MKNFLQLTYIIALFFTIASCTKNKPTIKAFMLPEVINSNFNPTDSSRKHKEEYISGIFPVFYGKYPFTKQIDIAKWQTDTTYRSDFFRGYLPDSNYENLDATGFELFVDYDQTVFMKTKYHTMGIEYYPVYIVNSTQNDKIFNGKDSHIYGIQEARYDRSWPNWYPVEAEGVDFCGNGQWKLIVHPNEFVLILMKKYEGNFETDLRVRLKIGDNILVSKSFIGTIHKGQFRVEKGSYIEGVIEKGHLFEWFYGTTPLDEDYLIKD
mgnify:CR=1 FL=1